jgi:hypothetical protein
LSTGLNMSNVKTNDGEDVLSLLDSLGDSAQPPTTAAPTDDRTSTENEKELLGFLDDLAKPSRSQTPRPTATRTSRDSARASVPAAKRPSVEKPAEKRVEKPVDESAKEGEASGGGWLGGLWSIGSAAMKTAEQKVKELQQTEEAKVWEEKLRGNVSVLGKFGKSHSFKHVEDAKTKVPIYEPARCLRYLLLFHQC